MPGNTGEAGTAAVVHETAQEVAIRLGIDPSQVRRYCEQGRFEGAFKPHPRMWLIPRGAVPRESEVRRRPPSWAPGWATPRTVGQIYGISEGSWRTIGPEEASGIDLYAAAPGRAGVTADVINLAPGMVEVADELFSFRYAGDQRTPLPAALFMGRGYLGAQVVAYGYDLEGRRFNFGTLTVTKELLAEGEKQTERLREAGQPPRGGGI